MTNTTTQKQQQKRKFLLMLPLLTVPFLTFTFWALGGGNGIATDPMQSQQSGINMELPGIADNKTQVLDKLGHYKKSQTDSARFLQAVKNDPYYRMAYKPEKSTGIEDQLTDSQSLENGRLGSVPMAEFQDPNERLIMEKLEALNQTLMEKPIAKVHDKKVETNQLTQTAGDPTLSADLDRLDHMMQQMQAGNASTDPVIHETQTLTSGATVKLRLTEAASINGLTIPKDQLVYGTASLNGERLKIEIQHIRVHDQILPVALTVHDADGMEGIYIPGSLSREVTAQASDRAIQGFGISTFDTSLEAQAASAGIETAKTFLSKKTKLIQFTLKAGYQIWLSDEKTNANF